MSSKSLPPGQLRKFRSEVAKLKSLGLVSKRVDARSQKPTRYMREQVKQYADVLAGRAKVVKAKSASQAKDIAGDAFKRKGRAVVVPVRKQSDTVRLTKSGQIFAYGKENGRSVKRLIVGKQFDVYDRASYPRGPGIIYRMPFGNYYQSFDDVDDLFAFMFPYEQAARNPYRDWQKYVEIVYVSPDGASGGDDE